MVPPPGFPPLPQVPALPVLLSEVDLAGLVTLAPLAIGITRGPQHVVELLNSAACNLLGITATAGSRTVGVPLGTAAPILTDCGVIEVLDRVYATGLPHCEPQQRVLRCRSDRCEERIINLTCHPRLGRGGITRLQWYGLDLTEQIQGSRRLEFLAEAGPALLEASLEHRDALERAAQLAARALGDLCVINLSRPDGSLERAAVVHANPELAELAEQLRLIPLLPDSPNHQVLKKGRSLLMDLRDRDPWSLTSRGHRQLYERLDLASGLVVPLTARGRVLGTFSICSTRPDHYTQDDLALAEGMAMRAGLALDTAGLYDSERRARELADRAAAGTTVLLRVTAALSGAVSPGAIADVVVSQGADLLGAHGAVLFIRVPEGLRLVRATGWSLETLRPYQMMPLSSGTPLADTVLTGEAVWLENHDDMLARYPQSAPVHHSGGYQAAACLPMIVEDAVVGAMNFSFTTPRRFSTDDRTLLLTLAGQCAQALDRARLYAAEQDARAAAERQRDRVAVLAEASLTLDTPQSEQQRLQRLTRLVVPRIADWCAVHLVREGRAEQIAYTNGDPEKIALVEQIARLYPPREDDRSNGVAQVIRTGKALLISELSDAMLADVAVNETHLELMRALGMVSVMIVPLTAHGRTFGSITLIAAESGQRFDAEDLAFAQDLATRAALALDNARLYEEQRGIAATLQAALLPHELPVIPGLELAGRYVAAGEANEVGGDLYDVFASCAPRGRGVDPWSLVIGDVCGKGAAAAALTALIRYTVRAEASHMQAPCDVLRRLNEAIIWQLTTIEARFCTVIYGQITPKDQDLQVAMACAGHVAPRVLRRGGTVEVGAGGGTILGVYTEPELSCENTRLGPGDTLLLITDGVTEARGPAGFYGEERLDALLAGCTGCRAGSIADSIIDDVLRFQAGTPRDDVAVLVVQATGAVPAVRPERFPSVRSMMPEYHQG